MPNLYIFSIQEITMLVIPSFEGSNVVFIRDSRTLTK